jgi:hypothetical protein
VSKPLLIGMNNPISSRPEYVLWPDPPNCTGWRLWKMLHDRCGATKHDYIRAFDRMNLVTGKQWSAAEGRREAQRLRPMLRGRVVVLLGQDVRSSFGVPKLLIHPQEVDGVVWRQLPHPSGMNLWYNDPTNVSMAGMLLAELFEGAKACT